MGRKVTLLNYLRVDLYRAVISWRFLAGIIGVAFTMYLASLEGIASDTNVTYMVWLIVYGMPFMLCLVFSAFPFSGCFCEDFENKYAYLQVERGNPKVYAISKTITIMLVAELTMMFGVMLYVSLLHLRLPWFDTEDAICQSAVTLGGFRGIISNGHYLLYFALFGLQYGIMAGVLALLAAYVSLFISNKLLILAVPFMSFYLITYYSGALFGANEKLNLIYIFNATYNLWDNDAASFAYAIFIGLLLVWILGVLIICRIKRKMSHE
ncbi:MAG: hypothetical protein SPF19_06130 [Oliverpabstia sp.]|nr:hypothetical protein [Oliverpabstia sp.]